MHKKSAVKHYSQLLKEEISFWKFPKSSAIISEPLVAFLITFVSFFPGPLRHFPFFSEDGQLWGNPLYDWKAMEKNKFRWWEMRMRSNAALYDVIRIDHFIGIVNFWSIPAGSENAKNGKWP